MTFRDHEKEIINRLEHRANPLHIYCRLRKVLRKELAKIIARLYEKTIFRTVLHRLIVIEIHKILMKGGD